MRAVWQYWPGIIDDATIDNIIAEGERYELAHAGMGFHGSSVNNEYRSSDIRWINKFQSKWISDLIYDYVTTANRNAFGFNIDFINDIQYTTYKATENGKYDWHEDVFWDCPREYHRKLSFVMQLTDPSEYEGGVFEIDSQFPQMDAQQLLRKGTVVVFPSFIRHRVTPVTSGIRRSLVSWIEGPKFR